MKNFNRGSNLFYVLLTLGLIGIIVVIIPRGKENVGPAGKLLLAAAISADLSSAEDFSVLAALSMAANGTGTTVSGNLGLSPGLAVSRTGVWTVGGTEYFGTGAESEAAQADALDAFNDLAGQAPDGLWASASPTPGVYNILTDTTFAGPTLTLNGDYNDVWVFQIGQDMTFTGDVVLEGHAQACNVFWQIGRDATITSGSDFVGTLIASRDVTVASGATVEGRIISLNSSLVFESGNDVSEPGCEEAPSLTLNKIVVNDDGGAALESAWTLTADGPTPISGAGAAGATDVMSDGDFIDGTYTLSESAGPAGYTASSWSCVTNGDAPVVGASVTLGSGDTATCTITNNDNVADAPQLIVTKIVVNDDGRTNVIADFALFVDGGSVTHGVTNTTTVGLHTVSETSNSDYTSVIGGDCAADGTITLALNDIKTCTITNDDIAPVVTSSSGGGSSSRSRVPPLINVLKVPSPLALPSGPGPVTYTYTLHNIGTVAVTDITMVGDSCSPINFISGDGDNDGRLDVNEIWTYNCLTTLLQTHTNTVTATGWANGISAVDIASATVVVGIPLDPPLIHVTKIPSPLALGAGGGLVTYTNRVTNLGTVPLSNVSLTDDKCGPVNYISGDTNTDARLDVTETWVYTCAANLSRTTTNTVTASGTANGFTATDFAIATVVVSAIPLLPNTGFPPLENSTLVFLLSLCAVSLVFYATNKKQIV